jgi:tetratricopeptide (TPR) repeat protein
MGIGEAGFARFDGFEQDDQISCDKWVDGIPQLALLHRLSALSEFQTFQDATPSLCQDLDTTETQAALSLAYHHHVKAGDYFLKNHFDITQPCNLLDEALNAYTNAAELANSPAQQIDSLVKQSLVLLHQGKLAKAAELVSRAQNLQSAQNSSHAGIEVMLGLLAFKQGQTQAALDAFEPKKGSKKARRALTRQMSQWLSASKLFFYSAKAYRLSALRCQEFTKILYHTTQSAMHLLAATVTFLKEQLQTTQHSGAPVIRLKLKQWKSLFGGLYAIHRAQEKQDAALALEEAYKLYADFPGFAPLMVLIGQLYESCHQRSEAVAWYQKALSRNPLHDEALFHLAEVMDTCNAPQEALELYSLLLERQPGHPVWQARAGQAAYRLGDFQEAANHLQIALLNSADAGNPYGSTPADIRVSAAYELARLYERRNNLDGAIMAIQHAVQTEPANSKHYMKLGLLHFEKQDLSGAKAVYEQALRFNPSDAPTHANLGYLAWLDGDVNLSMAYYERAIALDETYEIPLNNLGRYLSGSFWTGA